MEASRTRKPHDKEMEEMEEAEKEEERQMSILHVRLFTKESEVEVQLSDVPFYPQGGQSRGAGESGSLSSQAVAAKV